MVNIGVLHEIEDIYTVWPNGSNGFTEWLANEENINLLSESIGLGLSSEEKRSLIGNFHGSVLASSSESETDRCIIIVSNLSPVSDSEIGQLMTSVSQKNADVIVWILRNPDAKHKIFADWLNSHTADYTSIYLCTIRLFKIGNSEPAVKFEVVSHPNNNAVNHPKISDNTQDIEKLRFDYWNAFQDYAFDGGSNPKFAASYKRWQTSSNYGVVFGTGRSGCSIIIAKTKDDLEAGLNITDDRELFNYLIARKNIIESECGLIFDWLELSDKKGNRIRTKKSPAPLSDKSSWPEQFEWIMSSVLKIREVFGKFIKESDNEH
ncbi:MAG: DUF4268 domain-containing protein [Synergistaceae bacterium]|nr:DUF4268 domain-containing protein [Synergistaceae bacterium]